MRSNAKPVCVRLNFRANGLEFRDALLRPSREDATDFQLVVEHAFLGSFALHAGFVLELRKTDEPWRTVQLEELKLAFLEASQKVRASYTADERARNRCSVGAPWHPGTTAKLHFARFPVEGDEGHIERAKEALSRGGMRYKIVGGSGNSGRSWGHSTLQVASLPEAHALLCDRGFIPSLESAQVLIDSLNGWKVRLLETSSGFPCG